VLNEKNPHQRASDIFSIAAHLSLDKPPWPKLGWWDYSRPDDYIIYKLRNIISIKMLRS
tara:strand:- start:231 stop:407 length:177 start_codon:yes stop_codon:yes gene_type:complete